MFLITILILLLCFVPTMIIFAPKLVLSSFAVGLLSIITIALFVGFIIFAFWLGVHLLAFILIIAFIIWAAGAFVVLINK